MNIQRNSLNKFARKFGYLEKVWKIYISGKIIEEGERRKGKRKRKGMKI